MCADSGTRPRPGLTIVEVVIVLAIIGLLIGLLIPAVQRVRETAAQAQCRARLRQLALAAHAYEAQKGALPPGYLGELPVGSATGATALKSGQWVGVLPFLLPFMEQDGLVRQLNVDWRLEVAPPPWWADAKNTAVAGARLVELMCPSDDPYANEFGVVMALGFFATGPDSSGMVFKVTTNPVLSSRLGRTNYVGVAGEMGHTGQPKIDGHEGIFSNRSRVRLSDVVANDGTSNVLLMGESLGGSYPGARDRAFSWLGVGVTSAAWGIPSVGDMTSFSSRHPRVVHFALCDGSVRPLLKDSDITAFIQWSAYRDGRVKDPW